MAWYDGAEVRFYDLVDDALLKFAVIIARTGESWVFCRQKGRDTYELPGGHREAGESILETAKRELQEETGALTYSIEPVCVYSVTAPGNFGGEESFGMLYHAEIREFETQLHSEMESILITRDTVENWTYPPIHPKLIAEARRRGSIDGLSGESAGHVSGFGINEMLDMQRALQEKYKDSWEPIGPAAGRHKLLWLVGELGEVIDIVKKHGGEQACTDPALRGRLTEELADVLMYYNDVLLCYGIGAEELKRAYTEKFRINLKRW